MHRRRAGVVYTTPAIPPARLKPNAQFMTNPEHLQEGYRNGDIMHNTRYHARSTAKVPRQQRLVLKSVLGPGRCHSVQDAERGSLGCRRKNRTFRVLVTIGPHENLQMI